MDTGEKDFLPLFQGLSIFLKQQQTFGFCPQSLAACIAQAAYNSSEIWAPATHFLSSLGTTQGRPVLRFLRVLNTNCMEIQLELLGPGKL